MSASPACAEFNREVISARTQTDDQLVSGSRPRTALRRTEFDHNARDWRRATDCGRADRDYAAAAYHKALSRTRQITPRKIENQPIRMLQPAHLRLHQFAKRNFHIDAVGVFQDRYAGNLRMRTARSRIRALLRDTWRCRQGRHDKYENSSYIDTHGCGGLRTSRSAVSGTPRS
jgi:hypothetical protein